MLDVIDLCTPASCNRILYFFLNEDFLLMSSLPGCLVYYLDELSKWLELFDLPSTLYCFRLCHVNNSACYLDKLSWFVEYFSVLLLCHVNNSLYVDLYVDNLSWSVECMSGLRLCHVNNSACYLDKLWALVSTERTQDRRSQASSASSFQLFRLTRTVFNICLFP